MNINFVGGIVFATITVPNGRIWKLDFQKLGGRIVFVDGWQEFVEYHSIDSGYFLVFRYDGFSKFHVCILDESGTEIYYPWNAASSDVEPHSDKESSEDHDQDNEDDDDDDVEIIDNKMFASRRLSRRQMSMKNKRHVPMGFVMTYMQGCSQVITLTCNGKKWQVTFSLKEHRTVNRIRISKGWRGFVRDNNLGAGDVCVFELIMKKATLLKVSIYYADPAKKCSK
nr:B3 domain-containing transcription factor VRN1-like [Ziziphus jujuba var. spinosa]